MQNKRGAKTAPTGSENGACRRWAARAAARRLRDLFRPTGSEFASSTAVTVESTGNDARQRSKTQDMAGPQRVVKHTFVEFKADELELAVRPPTRRRANTDSEILKYSKSRQESWEPEAERLSSTALGKTIIVTGEDDENENSEDRCCEAFLGASADSQGFLSILTADGFEDDMPEAHIAYHLSSASESSRPSSSSVCDVLGAYPQGEGFHQGGGVYCMGSLQHERPSSWLLGSSNQHNRNDLSLGTLGKSSNSWSSPMPSHSNKEDQTTFSNGREGRFAVELDKLLNQDLVQANTLDPHSGTSSISNSKESQRRSQELNVIAAEIHAARLKAYALEAEAAARQAWFEAYATPQAEVFGSASSGLTMGRHSAPPTFPLMAHIAESSAENSAEPTCDKDWEAKSVFARSGHVRSPSDRSDSSWCSGERKSLPQDPDSTNTTVMMRHMPPNYTREKLLSLLDSEGFLGSFDFVYLPVDFITFQGFGYAFINCISNREAHRFFKHFQGFTAWPPSHMTAEEAVGPPLVCEVSWGDPLQGRAAHIDRYRNSPVMHKDVPEQFKPVTFENGVRVKFPTPTKRIRPPRLKHGHPSDVTKSGRMTLTEQLDIKRTVAPADAAAG